MSAEVKRGRWTNIEDELLKVAVQEFNEKCWREIAARVQGRTPIQCLHRWNKVLKPGLVKGPWTLEEDTSLAQWVATEGPTKWSKCSLLIPGRSGKQCRERWMNSLCPDVKKGNWTSEEDAMIFKLYNKHGPRWSVISKMIEGRTENSVKNRFYSTIRRLQASKTEEPVAKQEQKLDEQPDPLQKMIELLAQMQQLESILNATKSEIANLEGEAKGEATTSILS
mmetsp:Transcript_22774/g.40962  ORF Transcript_22774/g.40962 Transcript_22774/m.40962 type:complete len:224 (+) Transcript_22774:458-1129(+)